MTLTKRLTLVHKVRELIDDALRGSGVHLQSDVDGPGRSKQWCVKGDVSDGLFANVSDRDDVVELGLLERVDGEPVNRLHLTLVLDENSIIVNSISETQEGLNFDGEIGAEADLPGLTNALNVFLVGIDGPSAD